LPADTNVGALASGDPVTLSMPGIPACGTECAGTAYVSALPWYTLTSPVVPGETITLDLIVTDTGDPGGDTSVLFDQFRWSTATVAAPSIAPRP
jgi:hypothetical protein